MPTNTFSLYNLPKKQRFKFIRENRIFGLMKIADLKPNLLKLFNTLDPDQQANVIYEHPCAEFAEKAIELYSKANSYRDAEWLGELVILSMTRYFYAEHILKMLEVVKNNRQIHDATGTPEILEKFFDNTSSLIGLTKEGWQNLMEALRNNDDDLYTHLWQKIEKAGIVQGTPCTRIEKKSVLDGDIDVHPSGVLS